ncbi:MAG TPA: YceI family protein [Gemmatimonadaceae bacterium]|nr:YceI family protein [Gemmatimonadaceae bacterium]
MNRKAFGILIVVLIGAIALLRYTGGNTDAATVAPTPTSAAAISTAPALAGLHLVVAPAGNEARYRIREQLVRVDLPNDAVGKTTVITGGLGIGPDGKIIPAESKFVVDVSGLKSDRDRRDGFVRSRVLETDQYPSVEFVPTGFIGLPRTLPTSGSHTFDIVGNLTVRGVTKPVTWHVTAEPKNGQVVGSAATQFTFSQFNIAQPRVPIVLSVADTIKLEYDFTLVPKS